MGSSKRVVSRRLLALGAGAVLLGAAPTVHAGGAPKAGEPFFATASVMLDERTLASGGATHVLVALRGQHGAVWVRRAGGTLLDPELRLWRVREGRARPLIAGAAAE